MNYCDSKHCIMVRRIYILTDPSKWDEKAQEQSNQNWSIMENVGHDWSGKDNMFAVCDVWVQPIRGLLRRMNV